MYLARLLHQICARVENESTSEIYCVFLLCSSNNGTKNGSSTNGDHNDNMIKISKGAEIEKGKLSHEGDCFN
jgi:hypothetical protein